LGTNPYQQLNHINEEGPGIPDKIQADIRQGCALGRKSPQENCEFDGF
jgi:hypothetical protein